MPFGSTGRLGLQSCRQQQQQQSTDIRSRTCLGCLHRSRTAAARASLQRSGQVRSLSVLAASSYSAAKPCTVQSSDTMLPPAGRPLTAQRTRRFRQAHRTVGAFNCKRLTLHPPDRITFPQLHLSPTRPDALPSSVPQCVAANLQPCLFIFCCLPGY